MVPLTIAERKHLMPRGAQMQVATSLGLSTTYVSAVMNDETHPKTEAGKKQLRRVRVALARKLGRPVDEVFPPDVKQEAAPVLARAS